MWQIPGLVLLCVLLSPSQGVTPPGLPSAVSPTAMSDFLSSALVSNGLFPSKLQGLQLPDIPVTAGLLGSLGAITGLNIVTVQVTGVSVTFLAGIGIDAFIYMRLTIGGFLVLGLPSPITITADGYLRGRYGFSDFSAGAFQVVFGECGIQVTDISITALSTLSLSLKSLLQDSLALNLPHLVCPVVKVYFDVVKVTLLGTLNVDYPVGTKGAVIKYRLSGLPVIADRYVVISVNVEIWVAGGGILSIPDSAITLTVPVLQNYKYCLALGAAYFNMALSVLVQVEPQEVKCTPDVFSGATDLRAAILALIPSEGSAETLAFEDSSSGVLYLAISVVEGPVVTLGIDKFSLRLTLQIKALIRNADGSVRSLCVLRAVLVLDAKIVVADSKVIISLSLARIELSIESSEAGISEVSSLVPHFQSVLSEVFVPIINRLMGVGIPLPQLLGIQYINTNIQFAQTAVVLCV